MKATSWSYTSSVAHATSTTLHSAAAGGCTDHRTLGPWTLCRCFLHPGKSYLLRHDNCPIPLLLCAAGSITHQYAALCYTQHTHAGMLTGNLACAHEDEEHFSCTQRIAPSLASSVRSFGLGVGICFNADIAPSPSRRSCPRGTTLSRSTWSPRAADSPYAASARHPSEARRQALPG